MISQPEVTHASPLHSEMEQKSVDRYFADTAGHWDAIYKTRDLDSLVYQYRQAVALRLIDDLRLPPGARILEIGCGAGALTMALVRRGYHVRAIDRVSALLELLEKRSTELGCRDRVDTSIGDAHRLYFTDGSFDLVVALGVIPWLHSPAEAVREISRVLRPGGYAILTADNRWRLTHLLDPRWNPSLAGVRRAAKHLLLHLGIRKPAYAASLPRLHSIREIDAMLQSRRMGKIAGFTIGFGPFTFLGKRVLPDGIGKIVNRVLQNLADEKLPGLCSAGCHYAVLAQKEDPRDEIFVQEPEYTLQVTHHPTEA